MADQGTFLEDCWCGRIREVKGALEAGADPNNPAACGMSGLMVAIVNNWEGLVDLLLSWPGIDVNAKGENNTVALHLAARQGNVAILNKLLAVPGILVNERDSVGWTPIMGAIELARLDIVRVMAAVEKVDLDVRDDSGLSLEDLAYRCAKCDQC